MEVKKSFKLVQEVVSIIVIGIVFASSSYFYSHFPDQVPTHWNMHGEVDGWSNRTVGAFAIPVMLVAFYVMFLVLPKIDPKKERYKQFMKPYKIMQNIIISFMAILYFAASFAALGYQVPISSIVPVMVGLLFMVIGNYMGKIKRNWFVGIKTPWTLSSENVWNKTHRLGGRLFVLGGLIMMLMPFIAVQIKIYLFIFVVIVLAIVPAAYSYFALRKENGYEEIKEN